MVTVKLSYVVKHSVAIYIKCILADYRSVWCRSSIDVLVDRGLVGVHLRDRIVIFNDDWQVVSVVVDVIGQIKWIIVTPLKVWASSVVKVNLISCLIESSLLLSLEFLELLWVFKLRDCFTCVVNLLLLVGFQADLRGELTTLALILVSKLWFVDPHDEGWNQNADGKDDSNGGHWVTFIKPGENSIECNIFTEWSDLVTVLVHQIDDGNGWETSHRIDRSAKVLHLRRCKSNGRIGDLRYVTFLGLQRGCWIGCLVESATHRSFS